MWKGALFPSTAAIWVFATVLALSALTVSGQDDESEPPEFLANPECWVNWQVATEEEGVFTDACRHIEWVKIVNVVVFYTLLCYVTKALMLSTV
mmetsp:Transcript_35583/g.81554  ORF Transcript_35583/g.81554 Transcript_35583/m.81554 type:complete len:94 (+) Transcript_35583:35-316(+)